MTSWVARRMGVLGLLFASVLAGACGDDAQDNSSSAGKDGGTSGEPAAGKGGKGGRGGSSAASGGKGGSSGRGGSGAGSGGGNTTSDPGEFADYWKRRSVHMTVIDATNPTDFKDETIELPDRIKNPVDGREVDLYIQIKDDQRYTYALFEGDQVYYRMITKLIKTDETYFDSAGGETQIYEIEDGALKDTRITAVDTFSLSSESKYEKAAQFPPSDWPEKMLDTVEVMP